MDAHDPNAEGSPASSRSSSLPTLDDLARLVLNRRTSLPVGGDEVGLSQREASGRGSMSAVTWRRVETGQEVRSLSYSAIEDVLRWQPGSIRRYLDKGIEPADLPSEPTREDNRQAPTIYEAEFDELLAELRRRWYGMLESRFTHLRVTDPDAAVETPASVEGRGMLPGLLAPERDHRAPDQSTRDVAEGGTS